MFPNDFGDGFFRLPKYVVSFETSKETHVVNYGDGETVESVVRLSNALLTTLLIPPSSGSLFGAPGDHTVPGSEELFVGELSAIHPVRVHQLGEFCRRTGYCAREDGLARHYAFVFSDHV